MKIKQTENELIIQETPGCLWIFGLFFAVIGGIFVYGSLGGFTNYKEVEVWTLGLSFLMGAIGVACGVWIISRAPISKIVVNRIIETVVYTKYGFSGREEFRFGFDEIKQFYLIEEKDDESNLIWSLAIKLADGDVLKISSLPSHSEEYKRNFVFQINEFMRKQMPSYNALLELEDENSGKIS